MRDTYSSEDFPFTVEDWTDPNHLAVLAVCRNCHLAIGAWEAQVAEHPERKLVARWHRAHTLRRNWEGD